MSELKWDERAGYVAAQPKPKWECKMFPDKDLMLYFMEDVPWSRRMWTTITLGSKWKRL